MWDSVVFLLPVLVLLSSALLLKLVWNSASGVLWRLGLGLWARLRTRLGLPQPHSDRPQLICKPSALARFLLRHCGALAWPTLTPWPWGDPHVQTLHSLAWPAGGAAGRVDFAREHLELRDGGIVALDWAVAAAPGGSSSSSRSRAPPAPACPPILIVIPNSWGRRTLHLQLLCRLALAQGFYPVVFNRRGQGGCPLVTPALQPFGEPSDLMEAVSYIRCRHPSSSLLAVSEGSGSGLLLSYLGECGSSSYLTAAACLSPIFLGQQWFETPLPAPYRLGLLLYQKLQISRYGTALSAVMDVQRLLRCSSLREFEEIQFCSGGTGEKGKPPSPDWEAYWERNEPLRDVDEVAVPVLCLCSWDDPVRGDPHASLPLDLFQTSPYFLLALTGRGGHCGLRGGREGSACWSHSAVLEYFRVVGEFLQGEERGRDAGQLPRHRTSTLWTRRRRGTLLRRDRHSPAASAQLPEDLFQWQRSYTR
uniref:Abhydrolase domain containing 15 n=1 Tax=Lepisosteus oculatus TaxID=7918 RepID=W5MHM8_LEPOC|nr:PREDICTED: abhydrolase domain-containing protein 15 isoform X1 [Lepisosteus oculatus]